MYTIPKTEKMEISKMIEHPLIGELKDLTLEEIQSKLSELSKKLAFAHTSGNQSLVNQIMLVQGSYQEAYRIKMDEMMPKGSGDKYADKIDIGK